MKQWLTLFNKEWLEMRRNYKWIWIPLVFIVLGITDPITSYYMPIILETIGELPEGAVIQMPLPSSNEALLMSMNQLGMLGVLVIVLASMSTISAERKSGLASMVLVKPIPIRKYIMAKWVSLVLIGLISLFLGYFAGWYYISILFGTVPFSLFMQSYLIFSLWFIFILTITVFFSAMFEVGGIAGFITLLFIIALNLLTNIFGDWMSFSPALLTDSAASIVMIGEVGEHFIISILSTVVIICLLLLGGIKVFKNKELA